MICKWCGETLKTGDKTCRRCRREVPALSDCGGFYDLVPGAMPVMPSAAYTAEKPRTEHHPDVQPVMPVLPDHEGNRSRRKNLILTVSLLLVAVLLVSLFIQNNKLLDANETIEQLQSRLEKSQERVEEDTEPEEPTVNEDPTQEPTDEITEPTLGGKDEEDGSDEQGNQKEDNVISLQIDGDEPFALTDAQAALLQTEPLRLEVKDEDGELVLSLCLVLDHEAKELTIWVLEGMETYDDIRLTWMVTRTGAELDGEEIITPIAPEGVPQLEWGEDETEGSVAQYLGCRLNIENYSLNSLLECRILCFSGGEELVNITVSGVTLQ